MWTRSAHFFSIQLINEFGSFSLMEKISVKEAFGRVVEDFACKFDKFGILGLFEEKKPIWAIIG